MNKPKGKKVPQLEKPIPPAIAALHRPIAVRNGEFIGNTQFSDMFFYVEQENIDIPAHRVIVASASTVLEKFINGNGTAQPSTRITVSDISASDFREILRYIYTDEIVINDGSAMAMLRVANYFDLPYVEELCVEGILNTLNIKNVCSIYSHIVQLNVKLARKCVQLIQCKTDVLMKNGSLMELDKDALTQILRLDNLNIKKEKDIFEALLQWATEQCQDNQMATTAKNRRYVLGDRLKLVRFTAMDMTEFLECVNMDPAFFSSDEVADIVLAIRTGSSPKQPFYSNIPRQPISPTILTSHLFHWQSKGINYRNFPPEVFVLKAIAPILVYGFGIYGRNGLEIHNSENQRLPLKEVIYNEETEISKVMLEQTIVVTPEQSQTFTAYHDPMYGKFFYFFQMEHKVGPSVFFGYNFGTAYTNKYVRVVEIYYEDLV